MELILDSGTLHIPLTPFESEHLDFLRWSRKYQLHHDGMLPNDAFWHRLEHRHDLNPARFDRWHPHIARWIEQEEGLKHMPMVPPVLPPPEGPEHTIQVPQILLPPEGPGHTIYMPPPIVGGPVPSAVPEPSGLVMVIVAIAAFALKVAWDLARRAGTGD
jgi:hypothetical protein